MHKLNVTFIYTVVSQMLWGNVLSMHTHKDPPLLPFLPGCGLPVCCCCCLIPCSPEMGHSMGRVCTSKTNRPTCPCSARLLLKETALPMLCPSPGECGMRWLWQKTSGRKRMGRGERRKGRTERRGTAATVMWAASNAKEGLVYTLVIYSGKDVKNWKLLLSALYKQFRTKNLKA